MRYSMLTKRSQLHFRAAFTSNSHWSNVTTNLIAKKGETVAGTIMNIDEIPTATTTTTRIAMER